ncbi:large ribosomal subunit protein bL28c [Cryptomeria japonica]|uniref:large ribosomal subunit protein bL28c n=1 Tax=Cryptomeria japonica TaxID=3369 RepID=UPI0025ACEB64|nr:large ribosomal subunit protein bL28c [Cryptomeria japonica]
MATTVLGRLSQSICPTRTQIANTNAKADALSFSNSQFLRGATLKMACCSPFTATKLVTKKTSVIQIVASRVCPFTGKRSNNANKVSFSNKKTKKLQMVNLQYKRYWWETGKRFVKLRLSTKAIRTIEKNGLDATAKKAGIDLRKM